MLAELREVFETFGKTEKLQEQAKKVKKKSRKVGSMDVLLYMSSLGIASYYQKFIKNFASFTGRLLDLKEDADVIKDWTPEQNEAMRTLEEKLINPPILAHDVGVS